MAEAHVRGGRVWIQAHGGSEFAKALLVEVLADLQLCSQYFQAKKNPVGSNDKGLRWAIGGLTQSA